MARQVSCVKCGNLVPLPWHCANPACSWVRCEVHGNLRLPKARQQWLRGKVD